MDKWKERIIKMLMIRNELYEADKTQLWEYYYPEVAAQMNEIITIQKKMKVKLSEEYINFLLCADGWKCFYQLVDLFGTKDFETEIMVRAKRLLNVELEYNEALHRIKNFLFPIAVSRTDKDLFVMVLTEGTEYGQIGVKRGFNGKYKNLIGIGSTLQDVKKYIGEYCSVYDTYEIKEVNGICFELEDVDDWKELTAPIEYIYVFC